VPQKSTGAAFRLQTLDEEGKLIYVKLIRLRTASARQDNQLRTLLQASRLTHVVAVSWFTKNAV
jgi:hypothetical protein